MLLNCKESCFRWVHRLVIDIIGRNIDIIGRKITLLWEISSAFMLKCLFQFLQTARKRVPLRSSTAMLSKFEHRTFWKLKHLATWRRMVADGRYFSGELTIPSTSTETGRATKMVQASLFILNLKLSQGKWLMDISKSKCTCSEIQFRRSERKRMEEKTTS